MRSDPGAFSLSIFRMISQRWPWLMSLSSFRNPTLRRIQPVKRLPAFTATRAAWQNLAHKDAQTWKHMQGFYQQVTKFDLVEPPNSIPLSIPALRPKPSFATWSKLRRGVRMDLQAWKPCILGALGGTYESQGSHCEHCRMSRNVPCGGRGVSLTKTPAQAELVMVSRNLAAGSPYSSLCKHTRVQPNKWH